MSERLAIQVLAQAQYLADHSAPAEGRYAFAYVVQIRNVGAQPARLLRRHWIITDARGLIEEVEGDGVVGQQPLIAPGDAFEYQSGAILATPIGTMHGSYRMVDSEGCEFDASIPEFVLAAPQTLH